MSLLQAGDRVLFIGDSITNAFRMPEEINDAYQLGAGFALLIGANLKMSHPHAGLSFVNRGVSGNTTLDLARRWDTDCLAEGPTVVSVLIGINDSVGAARNSKGNELAAFEVRLTQMLAQTVDALPDVRLVLCEPFGLCVGSVTVAVQSELALRQAAVRRVAAASGARFVPIQAAFDAEVAAGSAAEYWIYDGIHPTAAGHALIARQWLDVVVPAGALAQTGTPVGRGRGTD